MSRYSLILFCLILIGCDKHQIGERYQKYDWVCVKTEASIGIGLGPKGQAYPVATSHCAIYECYKQEITTDRFFDDVTNLEIVDHSFCIR